MLAAQIWAGQRRAVVTQQGRIIDYMDDCKRG
jgi:hypothetical protein